MADQHPRVKDKLRRSSLQLALKRTITLAALHAKMELVAGHMEHDQASDELTAVKQGSVSVTPFSVSELLEKKLHATVGGPWREVVYDEEHHPVGIREVPGKGYDIRAEEAEALLAELLKAPKGSRDQILTRMVYESNKKIEAIHEFLKPHMTARAQQDPESMQQGGGGGRSRRSSGETMEEQEVSSNRGGMSLTNLFQDRLAA